MICPECGSRHIEFITNDIALCECGYSDEACMFDVRYQRQEARRNGRVVDEPEESDDGETATDTDSDTGS